jgi:steroid 5-alpha reductase family enzyme
VRPIVTGPGEVLPIAAVAVATLVLLTWVLSIRLRDASVIDPVWGPAFVVVALVGALDGGGAQTRRWLLLGLTAVWGLRLGVYLTRRKLSEKVEDRRYGGMRTAHPHNFALWSLWAVYALQGLLVLLISLPIQVGDQRTTPVRGTIAFGVACFAIGVLFEAVGDEQLRRFKSDPGSDGKVMDRGLWRYTRHPNYFGDACVWWGLWLITLPAGGTWWTVIGPIVMTALLVRISGQRRLEQDISTRRPAYADYIRRTSGFVPLPPRDSS